MGKDVIGGSENFGGVTVCNVWLNIDNGTVTQKDLMGSEICNL